MSSDESIWRDRATTAEAKLATMKDAYGPAIERIQVFKMNFGVRERENGDIDVDFDKFVQRLGVTDALELRRIIDATYNITGEPGTKPHLKVVHGR